MTKGFSSKKTEKIYNQIIANNLPGEQFCELANRLSEYGQDLIYKQHKEQIDEFHEHHQDSIYDKIRTINK